MESWKASSWHSGSLTFVSPPTQQQHPSVRPLTINPSTSSVASTRFSYSHRKMAKIVSIAFTILIVAVIFGVVFGDTISNSQTPRSRLRAKSLSARKRYRNAESTSTPTVDIIQTPAEVNVGNNPTSHSETTSTTPKPKSKKLPRSESSSRSDRPPRDNNVPLPPGCGECDTTSCKSLTEKSCQSGLVLDRCSCCFICGSGEGNRCYNASIPNLSYGTDIGICGTGLDCILRKDLDENEPREALCECRDRRLVCGNDNQTYNSECKLRETAYTTPELSIAAWGPCVSTPWIPTPIENVTVAESEDASLSCEVKGFPSPVIHWEFLVHGSSGPPKILPGDDSSVVVTVRGGPEQTMSTSWIQIIAVTSERQGTYYCVATNSQGVTRSTAGTVLISHHRGSHSPANPGES